MFVWVVRSFILALVFPIWIFGLGVGLHGPRHAVATFQPKIERGGAGDNKSHERGWYTPPPIGRMEQDDLFEVNGRIYRGKDLIGTRI